MLISQTSEYALRAVVHLATNHPQSVPAAYISDQIQVPKGYLQKVLRMLARADILVAQRGNGGGFSLAKIPSSIRVLDVLKATDYALQRIENCPLGIKDHTHLCALHHLLDEQIASVESVFTTTSISDLLESTKGIRPLCAKPDEGPITEALGQITIDHKPV